MKYLSICSGIEAATVAWHPLGWQPVGFSEIEKFPSRVLAHHYPNVRNYGDVTAHKRWDVGDFRLLVGGTPCQSFSVAGLRKGMADPRGNLALTYLGIVDDHRPDWFVWENVPGVLSSNGGRDFGSFLGGVAELGYGFAYRVLDAQYVRVDGYGRAVPQRRRRVFVVGNSRSWRRAAAVLFERESLSGNSAPRREAGEGVAATIDAGAHPGSYSGQDAYQDRLTSAALNGMGEYGAKVPTLRAEGGDCGGGSEALIAHALRGEGFDASEDGTGRGTPIIAFQSNGGAALNFNKDISGSLITGKNSGWGNCPAIGVPGFAVRRLIPNECEKLQGFKPGYTDIPGAKDGPRYKSLGNSMAVNCMLWIGTRIQMVDNLVSDLTP